VEPGVGIDERRTALAPYLARLVRPDGEVESPGGDGSPPPVVLGKWEREAVRAALASGDEAQRGWEVLLAEGVALQTKYLAEIDQLAEAQPLAPEPEAELRQRVLHSLAIGLALMQELQRQVDAMVLAGEVEQARKLTGFRNRLGQLVTQMKERVGDDGIAVAEAVAAQMVTPVEPKKKSLAERLVEAEDDQAPQPARLEARQRPLGRMLEREQRRGHLKPLLIVLAAAVAVWTILIFPRALTPSIPELTGQDLAFSPAILEVIARPPSLFLVVDGGQWNRMTEHQRAELVRQIGETVEAAGYSGAQLRLDDGTTLAQWSETRGVKLVPRGLSGT
jgi:hypothetical protein